MKPIHFAGLAATLIALLIFLPAPNDFKSGSRTVEVNMTQFEFEPGRIEVNQGDEVVFLLTSSDVVHGFYLDGYDVQQRIEPGIPHEIRFVAAQSGKFRYRCSVTCGPLHPFMVGELVVETNMPFWRAAGLLFTLPVLFLWYLHQQERGHLHGKEETSFTPKARV